VSVALVREFRGVSAEQFDRLRAELGDHAPRGLILHVAGPSDGGWRTIDVWETKADSRRYELDQLVPALRRSGLTRPRPAELAVHHLLHGDAR
jgi:hypothetical protein